MPHLSRASYSWKKYPAFLTTEGQQLFRLYQVLSQKIRTRFGQWPGTESTCRHEDFQSSYRSETMCVAIGRYWYLFQAFNGGLRWSMLPIRTHSGILLWQSCGKVSEPVRPKSPRPKH